MKLALSGHSGFELSMTLYEGKLAVRKSTNDRNKWSRLKAQIDRQRVASDIYHFKTPDIYFVCEGAMFVVMEYIPWMTPCDFLMSSHRHNVAWFAEEILNYFDHIFTKVGPFDNNRLVTKAIDCLNVIGKNTMVTNENFEKIKLMVDVYVDDLFHMTDREDHLFSCHGDFTLSNLLVNPDTREIAWLDFLDGFNHSALVDLAKLSQETRYLWSLRFKSEPVDNIMCNAYRLSLSWVVDPILEMLRSKVEPAVVGKYLFLNDLRLLQHEKDPQWVNAIIESMGE